MKKALWLLGKKIFFYLFVVVFGFANFIFAEQIRVGDSVRIKNIRTGEYLTVVNGGIFGQKQPSDQAVFKFVAGTDGALKLMATNGRYVGRSGDTYVIYAAKRQLLGLSQNPSQFKILPSNNYGDIVELQDGNENVRMNVDVYTHPKGREVFFAGDDWRMTWLAKKWTKEFVLEFVSRPVVVTKPKAPVVVPPTPDKPIVISPESPSQDLGENLLNAAANNNLNLVEKLLNQGANVNFVGFDNLTPLHWAVLNSNLGMVKLLIEKGAFVNLPSITGKTALSEAQDQENKEIIDLVKAGKMFEAAKAEVPSEGGKEQNLKFFQEWRKKQPIEKKVSWLFKAIFDGNLTQLKDWLEAGASINGFDKESGKATLHAAIEKGNFEIVKYLVEKGADVNIKTEMEETPLGLALKIKNKKIIDFLKKKGAQLSDAEKPLEIRTNGISDKLFEEMKAKSPEKKIKSLFEAVRKNNLTAVKNWVAAGADLNGRDADNKSILEVAKEIGNNEIINYLISRGAK